MPLRVRLIDSEIEMIDLVITQPAYGLDHIRCVREHVSASGLAINQKAALPDLHVEPVDWDIQPVGKLVRSQDVVRMLPPRSLLDEPLDACPIAYALNGDREHLVGAIRRAMAFPRQDGRDLVVMHPRARQLDHALLHLLASRQPRHRGDPHPHLDLAHGAAAPHDAGPGYIMLASVENNLVHKTAQKRLALGLSRAWQPRS